MEKLKSRKLWMAIISGLLIIMNEGLGWNIPSETVLSFAAVVLGYLLSQGYVDGKLVEGDIYEIHDDWSDCIDDEE